MNTAGIMVQFLPEHEQRVRQEILERGCEIHLVAAGGKMVVTMQSPRDNEIAETIVSLQNISGVLAALLVFHHHDPLEGESS